MSAHDRTRQLARIHCLKRDLGLDDDSYRDVLWTLSRERSAKDLDASGRTRVIRHLESLAERSKIVDYPGKPRNFSSPDRKLLLRKIEALLSYEGRPWAYATAMAKHMFQRDAIEFCGTEELFKLVQALEVDRKRREKRSVSCE